MPTLFDTILVLDFGSQYSHLIIRRLRELNVYAEMYPCTLKLKDLKWTPKGIILSGGPFSVYDEHAPHTDPAVFQFPLLGICYGLQEIAWYNGKGVGKGDHREYGPAVINISKVGADDKLQTRLFEGLENTLDVWMSHGDKLSALPVDFVGVASTKNAPFAAITHRSKPIFGIQFHPEVSHTPKGVDILRNFAVGICGSRQEWTMERFVDNEVERIRAIVGNEGQVVGAVSGGVDSTVAAKIMHEAIGNRFHAILVDNGVMRLNECEEVYETLTKHLGINLKLVDRSSLFLGRLKGITDPEKKRKIIGNTFIEVFEAEAEAIDRSSGGTIEYLLQGTLYPDVIESISFKGPSQTIKTHHVNF